MLNNALTPLFGNNTTKAAIIQALQEKPLTIKEICEKTKSSTDKQITYQATHKAINEMVSESILEKQGRQIKINPEWIEKLSKFAANMKGNMEKPNYATKPKTETYEFETFVEFGKFIIRFLHDSPNPQKKAGVCIFRHVYPILGFNKIDYELFNEFVRETNFCELIQHKTAMDKVWGKTYEQMGKTIVLGSKIIAPMDIIVKGDYVAQIVFKEDFLKVYDELYEKYSRIAELQINDMLLNFIVKKTHITVTIAVDAFFADKIRHDALVELGKGEIPRKVNKVEKA